MDDISAESLQFLLQKKVIVEVNHRMISGILLDVQEEIVVLRTSWQGMVKNLKIQIDDIDAIMFASKGKQIEP